MIVCWDASAIIKLLIEEHGSDTATELWEGPSARLASSLVVPEVASALSRRCVEGSLAGRRSDQVAGTIPHLIRELDLFDLTAPLAGDAAGLVGTTGLRGADAVHLATALEVADTGGDVTLATWDRRLHAAASAEGLGVAPADID